MRLGARLGLGAVLGLGVMGGVWVGFGLGAGSWFRVCSAFVPPLQTWQFKVRLRQAEQEEL